MKLIVGLGNPGEKYLKNRHNVGFQAIDLLLKEFQVEFDRGKFNGIYYLSKDFILAKPLTYMNLSGDFVQAITHYYKISPSDILVIYDDMDTPIGKVVLKPGGSAGGQNGMKDIIDKMGTQNILRMKIGIGKGHDAIHHVLNNFTPQELNLIRPLDKKIVGGVKLFLEGRIDQAISFVNSRQ